MSPEILKTKAREISYALVRVSFYVKRDDLRQRLESSAFELLQNTAHATVDAGDKVLLGQVLKNISALDGLVRMGHSLYEIEPINATVLVRELDAFDTAMRQFGKAEEELPNLESFFTTSVSKTPDKNQVEIGVAEVQNKLPAVVSTATESQNNNNNDNENINGKNMAIRQTAIVNKIKDGNGNGGCRLKDLVAEFPYVSERTLRYDLQRLAEQGVLMRVGNGGPASYYRLKSE